MLLEDCQKLSQQAQDVVALKKYATDLNKFRDRENKIIPLVEELRPLVVALRAFREKGVGDCNSSQKADILLIEVSATLAEFQKDRGWLLEKFKSNTLQSKVVAVRNDLEAHLKLAWTEYKRQRMPNTNSELLELLAKIETFKPTVQTIQKLLNYLNAIVFPKDIQDFEQIDQRIDNLSIAWNSLRSSEVPEAVLTFLRAAATHGATIDLLTSEVQSWLHEHGISRFFYIHLSD